MADRRCLVCHWGRPASVEEVERFYANVPCWENEGDGTHPAEPVTVDHAAHFRACGVDAGEPVVGDADDDCSLWRPRLSVVA